MEQVGQRNFLVFVVGPYHFCGPAENVLGIINPPDITQIPFAPNHKSGTFLFRNRVVELIDMRRQLGLQKFQENRGLVLVLQLETDLVGFRVDNVENIVNSKEFQPCENLFFPNNNFVERFVLLENRILLEIDFETLSSQDSLAELQFSTERPIKPGQSEKHENPAEGPKGNGDSDQVPQKSEDNLSISQTGKTGFRTLERFNTIEDTVDPDPSNDDAAKLKNTAPETRKSFKSIKPLVQQRSHPRKTQHISNMDKRGFERNPLSHPATFSEIQRSSKSTWWITAAIIGAILLVISLTFITPDQINKRAETTTPKTRTSPGTLNNGPAVQAKGFPKSESLEKEAITSQKGTSPRDDYKQTPAGNHDEMLRVEEDDFILTIERPMPANIQPEPPSIQVAGQNGLVIKDASVIHIVVKGDTLWDIAKTYLENPLKYSELARLSQINDPHWIYPGDIIRITRKNPHK